MSRDGRPIGVFDSGLGGLTVVRSLIDLLPDEDIVYFGDTGRFPYGPKPADEVCKYSFEITDRLLDRRQDARGRVQQRGRGRARPLAAARRHPGHWRDRARHPRGVAVTETGRVGVIGTVGTISSGAYQRAATTFAPDIC